jgi:hypothetical protein
MVKAKSHIVIIIVLVAAFFVLLILSTSNSKITENYSFVDTIQINSFSDLDYVKIGDVTIENNGLLSSRIDLKDYIVCHISDYSAERFYEVQYRGASTVRGKAELFSYNYYQKRLDVSSGEKIELDISITPYSISKYMIEQENLYNTTLPFYLFEINNENDRWNFCNIARKEDAFKTIYITINIDPATANLKAEPVYKY